MRRARSPGPAIRYFSCVLSGAGLLALTWGVRAGLQSAGVSRRHHAASLGVRFADSKRRPERFGALRSKEQGGTAQWNDDARSRADRRTTGLQARMEGGALRPRSEKRRRFGPHRRLRRRSGRRVRYGPQIVAARRAGVRSVPESSRAFEGFTSRARRQRASFCGRQLCGDGCERGDARSMEPHREGAGDRGAPAAERGPAAGARAMFPSGDVSPCRTRSAPGRQACLRRPASI